ncbi:GtrA family protein [Sphingobium sp. SJ10-10]|uniref:GtrA family protein n=1 Tax=Sphingobium sp. SJ10-10 TaxID=3114999 RepID=UPI002E16EDB2|nr:GtrA family protein [Sphingobium sp. SJ10-10]
MVGLVNTAIGFSIILIALQIGINDYAANACGYGVGLGVSYFLNRNWTFNSERPATINEFGRFVITFCVAYAANLMVITACRNMGLIGKPTVHLAGQALYSVLFYGMSRAFVFESQLSLTWSDLRRMSFRYAPELSLVLAALAACFLLRSIPITHDVVWQFWIAQHILKGAILYRDIWEINPPLWFWSAVPIQYTGELLNASPLRLWVPMVTWGGAISACFVGHVVAPSSPFRRALIMLLAFWLCVAMPIYDFGQREQLALICALPYAALMATRYSGRNMPRKVAFSVGFFAAYGFALKHYFIAIPLLLELWLFLHQRRHWQLIRPETLTLALCALLYALSVLLWAPEFFTRMLPMILTAYHGYESNWVMVLLRPWTIIWLFVAFFFVVYGRELSHRTEPLVEALLIVSFSFMLSYLLQRKGWLYHSMPVTAALALAMGVFASGVNLKRWIPISAAVVILTLPILLPFKTGQYHNFFRAEIDPLLSTVPTGESVFIASGDPMWGWPTIQDHGLVWPSRLYAYWMLPAVGHGEIVGPNPAPLRQVARDMQDEAYLELRCARPALVMFERRRNYIYQPTSFDVRTFFTRKVEIREYLKKNYKEIDARPSMFIYRRLDNRGATSNASCQKLPWILNNAAK